jgi:hypothetical protein
MKIPQNFLKVLLVINSHKIRKFKHRQPETITPGDPTPGNTVIFGNQATSLYDAYYGDSTSLFDAYHWINSKLGDKPYPH